MLHTLAARALLMATSTGEDIIAHPTIIQECIHYVLRNMPAQLRTHMAFNIHLEIMHVIYESCPADFGNAKEFPPAPVDNYGYHFGL